MGVRVLGRGWEDGGPPNCMHASCGFLYHESVEEAWRLKQKGLLSVHCTFAAWTLLRRAGSLRGGWLSLLASSGTLSMLAPAHHGKRQGICSRAYLLGI